MSTATSRTGEEAAIVAAAAGAVATARAIVETYAGPFSPVRTDQVSALLAGTGCHVEIFPFRSDTVAMALPPVGGVHPILINRSAERVDRCFAFRHELAHVIGGDCDGPVFLADEGFMARPERIADLFALADLVPGWWIDDLRRGRTPWKTVRAEIALAVAEYGQSWPGERLEDRASLRLRLYRERAI